MIRTAAIGPEHRANLRRLRADFEEAFAGVKDISDRSSPDFLEADALFRTWIKAINEVAIALLDDIDALEGGYAEVSTTPGRMLRAAAPGVTQTIDPFADISDFKQVREIIGAPEPELHYDAPVEFLCDEL